MNMIKEAENEKNTQIQAKVDKALDILRHQEEIFRYIDLCKYSRIPYKRVHSLIG